MGESPELPEPLPNSAYHAKRWKRRSGGWASTSTDGSEPPLELLRKEHGSGAIRASSCDEYRGEKNRMAPSAIAEMVVSFFFGLCIERSLQPGSSRSNNVLISRSRPYSLSGIWR